ncbi:Alpha/Beta hydrolase protein [Crassisporium funariophilum]|nr:Alpha/Beta hydrolase protein [Crassisporium funariophilum]
MPVALESQTGPFPKLHHLGLETTFCGIEHKISTPVAPIHQYLGIKYATIPARFRQSRLCTSYPTITDASQHGPICPQLRNSKSIEETLFGIAQEDIPVQNLKQDEFECLNLNITCPAGLTPRSRIPVMLWIHGGGDKGSGSQWFYDGGAIVSKSIALKKPLMLVTCNFRIGLLGFATSPIIRDDNKAAGEEGTGNYGLRDQRTAMEWLHHHISDFGGDPNNITLFGAGSGAADIVCHLLSKANETKPLFHRAIVQSAVFEPTLPDVSNAGWHLSRVMSALQVSTIEKFRSVEVGKLLGLGSTLRAVDDGFFFREGWHSYMTHENAQTKHPQREYHHRETSRPLGVGGHYAASLHPPVVSPRVKSRSRSKSAMRALKSPLKPAFKSDFILPPNLQPLIIGDCSADALLWSAPISLWTPAGVARRLKAICQSLSKTNGILRTYDISTNSADEEIMERVLELVNDARIAWPTHCLAENAKQERGGKNVWRYVFDQEGPSRGLPHHAADLMYLFDNVPLPASALAASTDCETFYDGPFDVSDDEDETCAPIPRGRTSSDISILTTTSSEDEWLTAAVDEYSYARVRDAMQERWIAFAHAEVPWRDDKVFVFGPEGETGERSMQIFEGRRRKSMWKEALEPVGSQLVQKFGVELSRGPALGADRIRH